MYFDWRAPTRLRSRRDRDPDERNFRMHLAARVDGGDGGGVDDDEMLVVV